MQFPISLTRVRNQIRTLFLASHFLAVLRIYRPMSIDRVFPEQYEQQLNEKLAQLKQNFSQFQLP
jgi:hypothetical protein